jgi:hypothetical protein
VMDGPRASPLSRFSRVGWRRTNGLGRCRTETAAPGQVGRGSKSRRAEATPRMIAASTPSRKCREAASVYYDLKAVLEALASAFMIPAATIDHAIVVRLRCPDIDWIDGPPVPLAITNPEVQRAPGLEDEFC